MISKILVALLLTLAATASLTPYAPEIVHSSKDLQAISCLTENVFHEARGEGAAGQIAVALVTLNRTVADGFPDDVCQVVHEKRNGMCQFSWTCQSAKIIKTDYALKRKSREVAEYVYLNYSMMVDITNNSLFFHSTAIQPGWQNLKKTVKYGRHQFYTIKGKDV